MKPLLAITMGDPAGIGAEIIAKAYALADLYHQATPFVIGSAGCIGEAIRQAGLTHRVRVIGAPDEASDDPGSIQIFEPFKLPPGQFRMGEVSAECGRAAVGYFESAVNLCQVGTVRNTVQKTVQGIVTCPIHKEAVQAAGFVDDIGHQEILARLTGSTLTATLLMTRGLKVAHLSTHKSLAEAVAYVKKPVIIDKLELTSASLQQWGIDKPRIAVAALNPHGGEGGMLGREELDEIAPAVLACQQKGLNVHGPYPADSVFYRAIRNEFDVVLALYHDQGHIAIKVHDFEDSVTATMGIPFVRTSVDHGTAFDIAGKNKADARGLVAALDTAVRMLNRTLE